MEVKIIKLREAIGYKASTYKVWDSAVFQNSSSNDKEWSGLYIAEVEDTAKGYLPDTVESTGGTGTAYIHRVSLATDVSVVDVDDEGFKTGDISLPTLKSILRTKGVDVEDKDLLMPKLGELGYCMRCPHDVEGGIEIIVPRALADKVIMTGYKSVQMVGFTLKKETLV